MGGSASVLRATAALPAKADKLVIYDGVCSLCDHTVKFLIARDPAKTFKFVALQSVAAQPILRAFGISSDEALKSIVFVDDGRAFRKSAAALQIGSYLPRPYSLAASAGWCVPGPLRDAAYDCVASNRYRMFGRLDGEDAGACLIPTPDVLSRFLDAEEMKAARRRPKPTAEAVAGAGVAEAATHGASSGVHTGAASGAAAAPAASSAAAASAAHAR